VAFFAAQPKRLMTQASGARSLDNIEKRKRLVVPKSAGRLVIKAYSAFISKTEATRGAGRWSLDKGKSGSAWSGATGISRTGDAAYFAA